MMIALSLFWIALGAITGALANAARLRPTSWGQHGWLVMLGVGALAALLGGWLGVLLLERNVASAMALWIAVLGIMLPWLVIRAREWITART